MIFRIIYVPLQVLVVILSFNLNVEAVTPGMDEAICRDKNHFVDCFGWSHSDCKREAHEALSACEKRMPPRPQSKSTMEEGMSSSDGAMAWGLDFGLCGEVTVFRKNKSRVNKNCFPYFHKKERESEGKAFETEAPTRSRQFGPWEGKLHQVFQFLMTLIPGLFLPLYLASFIWPKKRPTKFPLVAVLLLIPVSLLGVVLGSLVLAWSGSIRTTMQIEGDNPMAAAGSILAFYILVPFYWVAMRHLYLKYRGKTKKGPTES